MGSSIFPGRSAIRVRTGSGQTGSGPALTGSASGYSSGMTARGSVASGNGKVLIMEDRSRGPCRAPGFPTGEDIIKTKRNDIVNTLETILLVDDEAYIRELVGAILTVEGYQVLEASDGEEALKVGGAYDDKIHLLLTDVVMSPMGGGELVKRILPVRPDLKVLYISGYPDDPAVRSGLDSGNISFLAKPFSPKILVRTIRSILDGVPAIA